jgi:hypothetical protein
LTGFGLAPFRAAVEMVRSFRRFDEACHGKVTGGLGYPLGLTDLSAGGSL